MSAVKYADVRICAYAQEGKIKSIEHMRICEHKARRKRRAEKEKFTLSAQIARLLSLSAGAKNNISCLKRGIYETKSSSNGALYS